MFCVYEKISSSADYLCHSGYPHSGGAAGWRLPRFWPGVKLAEWAWKGTEHEKIRDVTRWMYGVLTKVMEVPWGDGWISLVVQEQICKKEPNFMGGEYGEPLGRGILQGLGNLGNHVSSTICGWDHLVNSIRNTKLGYRHTRTGTSGVKCS